MAPKDYYATVEGYKNKKEKEANLLRLSVFASLSTWEGSISFTQWCQKFFPLPQDREINQEETAPVEMTQADIDKIFERHKMLHAGNGKVKQNG